MESEFDIILDDTFTSNSQNIKEKKIENTIEKETTINGKQNDKNQKEDIQQSGILPYKDIKTIHIQLKEALPYQYHFTECLSIGSVNNPYKNCKPLFSLIHQNYKDGIYVLDTIARSIAGDSIKSVDMNLPIARIAPKHDGISEATFEYLLSTEAIFKPWNQDTNDINIPPYPETSKDIQYYPTFCIDRYGDKSITTKISSLLDIPTIPVPLYHSPLNNEPIPIPLSDFDSKERCYKLCCISNIDQNNTIEEKSINNPSFLPPPPPEILLPMKSSPSQQELRQQQQQQQKQNHKIQYINTNQRDYRQKYYHNDNSYKSSDRMYASKRKCYTDS